MCCFFVKNKRKTVKKKVQFYIFYSLNQSVIDSMNQPTSPNPLQKHSLAPTLNELNFLTQKLTRLEEDYNEVCAQLQRVRARLRKAEDFEIKYDLLFKQKQAIQSQLQSKELLVKQYQEQIKQLQLINSDTKSLQLSHKVQKDNLLRELQQWRLRFLEAEQISSKIRADQEYKMSEKLTLEVELMKKQFINLEEEYKSKIRMLQITLAQKEALQSVLKQKNEKNTDEKDKEIQRLEMNLAKLRDEHLAYAGEKNNEIKAVAARFEQLFTHQIEKLKHLQQTNSQKFSLQVEGLRGLLQLKNSEITQLINESNEMRKSYLQQKTELLKEMSLLKEKLYQRERESELQLYNLKQRLIGLHKLDLHQTQDSFQKINLNLEENIKELEELIKKKDRDIEDLTKRFEARKAELDAALDEKDNHITELQDKLRHTANLNAKEIDNLHSSFHKITTEKGQLSTEYESTFTFLNNQIVKLTSSNELKNQEIKDLHLQISEIKKNSSEHVKDLQKKWRQERKQRQQERNRQREMREQLEVQFRQKQQKWRHRERILQRDKEKEERQKIKQKVTIEELDKNIERLTRHVKENEERLRQQMQRNQSTFVETGSVRRQLTGELQRQRAEFQSLKKIQIDQVHRQYEIEMNRVTNQNQKLQNQLTELRISFDKLQEEYKKVMNTKKNAERINKEKIIDHEKKMAALNAEINLTQNLYNSFMTAKSKAVAKKGEGES